MLLISGEFLDFENLIQYLLLYFLWGLLGFCFGWDIRSLLTRKKQKANNKIQANQDNLGVVQCLVVKKLVNPASINT